MTTTARADFVAALVTVLRAQATATPELLKQVHARRPGSFNELPLAYVGPRDESIDWSAGTRTRTFNGLTVVLADAFTDNLQTADRLDRLVDLLVDRLNAVTSTAVPNSILELATVSDFELGLEGGGQTTYYPAVLLTFARTFKKEGRD